MIEKLRKLMAAPGCIAADVPLAFDEQEGVVVTSGGYVAAEGWRTVTEAKLYAALRNNAAALLDAADSLAEIIDYRGGADSPLADEYVMARARRALAALEVRREQP